MKNEPVLSELIPLMEWEVDPSTSHLVSRSGDIFLGFGPRREIILQSYKMTRRWDCDGDRVYQQLSKLIDDKQVQWWREKLQQEIAKQKEEVVLN
jgi:hypothetical protein